LTNFIIQNTRICVWGASEEEAPSLIVWKVYARLGVATGVLLPREGHRATLSC
jgi:hypothetical protein